MFLPNLKVFHITVRLMITAYVSFKHNETDKVIIFEQLSDWVANNFLQLNADD